jgi:hypothetical protein
MHLSPMKLLTEGIDHLEDLDLQAFIAAVSNISKMQASEKLDGANLWFGLDGDGRLYTSRAGKSKSADNVYEEGDYPYLSSSNGFRATHAALKSKEDEIKTVLRPNDTVEIEVLFGRQPNAVTYGAGGKNYIAFIRGVEGTQDILVDQLANALSGDVTKVQVKTVDTIDGENLILENTELTFQFVGVQKIDTTELKATDVSKQLAALQKFLGETAPLQGYQGSNFDLLTSSLGSFDKEIRAAAKELKAKTAAKVMADFKLPIKRELLDKFVGKIKSPLAADDLSNEEDIGVEGVVLKDPTTGDQIKLVDKDTFTTINKFNYAVRSTISGLVKSTDPTLPLEVRGGILGQLKITIADLLGNKELARTQGAKKFFTTVKGKTPEDTVKNAVKELGGSEDYRGTKRKIVALIDNTRDEISQQLKDFKANKDSFQLKLRSGKSMGLSAEVIRRTLLAYAEAKRDVDEMAEKVNKAKSIAQVIAILYGRSIKAVHSVGDEETVTEGLLQEKRIFTDKAQYEGKDGWTLLNIYLATLMMSAIIYKTDDKLGIRILRDKTHCRLTAWSKEMSPLNFWGYPIWRVGTPQVKKLIGKKVAAELFRHTRKVPPNNWRFIHMDLSFGRDLPIDWDDHLKTLKVLQHYPGMSVDRINTLLDGVFHYEKLSFDERVKLLNKLYYFVQQFIPISPLASRLRAIQNELLLNANGQNDIMVQEMKLLSSIANLSEEGEVAAGPSGSTSVATSTATTSASIASYAKPIFGAGRVIKRVKRNPDIVRSKFPRPKDPTK